MLANVNFLASFLPSVSAGTGAFRGKPPTAEMLANVNLSRVVRKAMNGSAQHGNIEEN